MNTIVKPIAVLGLAGMFALAVAQPADAQRRAWIAAGAGFAAGAAIGAAAAANANAYYYREPGYAYGYPSAVYVEPGYDSYAYAPAPGYYGYRHGYDTNYVGPHREQQIRGW